MPSVIQKVREHWNRRAALATKFRILTGCRSGEVRNCQWTEFDLDAATWTITAGRAKTHTEHVVPLSDRALEILREAKAIGDGSETVFLSPKPRGGRKGQPIGERAFQRAIDSLDLRDANGEKVTPHGCRSTFQDWCAETGVSREVAEAALAHVVRGVEGTYFRSDLLAAL